METLQYSNNINFNYLGRRPKLDKERIRLWLNKVARKNKFEISELNYSFCTDAYLLEVNLQYLDHDYFTDIITFDLGDEANSIEGDIYISIDRVRDNAKTLGAGFDQELLRVIVHGLLHLIGYNDKTPKEEKKMRALENICMELY